MTGKRPLVAGALFLALVFLLQGLFPSPAPAETEEAAAVGLPEVKRGDPGGFADLLYRRRSVRSFSEGQIPLEAVSRALFAAQGITRRGRFRTVPSAGALYPLEVYLVAGSVQGLRDGVYRYEPRGHELDRVVEGDRRRELARECYGQMWIAEAQTVLVICAVFERVTGKYGQRGVRYVHIEAGCAAQNVSLQGYASGLGSTVVGAFSDSGVAEAIGAEQGEEPLIVMPLGLLP